MIAEWLLVLYYWYAKWGFFKTANTQLACGYILSYTITVPSYDGFCAELLRILPQGYYQLASHQRVPDHSKDRFMSSDT